MSDEAYTTLKVLFGPQKANQILLDTICIAQKEIDAGNAWACLYCGRMNKRSSVACDGCGATGGLMDSPRPKLNFIQRLVEWGGIK